MTAKDLIRFRDAVAAEVSEQYPKVDYLNAVVAQVIERRAEILGWDWMSDGPKKKGGGMKRIAIAGLAVALLSGCVAASISAYGYDSNGNPWSADVKRIAFIHRMEIPRMKVPGVFEMQDYKGGPDAETVKAIAGAPWYVRLAKWLKGG